MYLLSMYLWMCSPKDLLRLPLDCEIEFEIELLLGIAPISKGPYQMAPAELKELRFSCKICSTKNLPTPVIRLGEHLYCL